MEMETAQILNKYSTWKTLRVILLQFVFFTAIHSGSLFEPQQYSDGTLPSIRVASIDSTGLGALSFSFSKTTMPQWVARMFPQMTSASESACSVGILAALPRTMAIASNASINILSDLVSQVLEGYLVHCQFKTIPVGWERKPDSSHPLRPAFIFCPVNSTVVCTAVDKHNMCDFFYYFSDNTYDKSKLLHLYKSSILHSNISVSLPSSEQGKTLTAWFMTNAPSDRPRLDKAGIGVCTNAVRRSATSGHMLSSFARYYTGLKFDR